MSKIKEISIQDFTNKCVKKLKPELHYYTGFLMKDRENNASLDTNARLIWKLYKEKKVILYQKKIYHAKDHLQENNIYEYYAKGI